MAERPTQSFLDHLKLREGFEAYVYADSLKKLTGGTGHLLTKEELEKYKEGDKIDEATTTRWLKEDSSGAYNAAISQAKEAGITDQAFIEALGSVNFQLGTNWRSKMKNAWAAIEAGEFDKAINEIKFKSGEKGTEKSDWFTQTPTRVEDFSAALKVYSIKRDLALMKPDETTMDSVTLPPN